MPDPQLCPDTILHGVITNPASALCPQVAFQGVPHYHSLEIRDRFGNLLDGYPTGGGFTAIIIGTPDARAGVTPTTEEHTSQVTIATTVSEETDASGKLSANFTPDVAGTYVMSNEFTGPGGLLATFFRTKDFMDPVLENLAYATEVKLIVQAWLPQTVSVWCFEILSCVRHWCIVASLPHAPSSVSPFTTDFASPLLRRSRTTSLLSALLQWWKGVILQSWCPA